jgi:integral membrane protein
VSGFEGSLGDVITAEDVPAVRSALLRYRVMAWIVGVLLVVLVCVGVPLKYLGHNDTVVTWTGVPHGWLYLILLITAYDLGRRVNWPWLRLILIALAGTVPFLSFVAERYATSDVRTRLAQVENGGAAGDSRPDVRTQAAEG